MCSYTKDLRYFITDVTNIITRVMRRSSIKFIVFGCEFFFGKFNGVCPSVDNSDTITNKFLLYNRYLRIITKE